MSIPMAPSSEIFIDDILKKSLIFKEKRLDLIGRMTKMSKIVQTAGKEAIEMEPGDTVNIPADVKHWHGAAPDSWFSHLAIEVPGVEGMNG